MADNMQTQAMERLKQMYSKAQTDERRTTKQPPTLKVEEPKSEALKEEIYLAEDSVLKKWMKPPYSIDAWRFDVAETRQHRRPFLKR